MSYYQAHNIVVVELDSGGINSSQTTLPLASGEGANLSSTTGGYYPLVIWNSSGYHSPHEDPNFEIVLVTSHDGSSDTLAVISRAQESTSAVAHNQSGLTYKAVAGFTKAIFDALFRSVSFQHFPKFSLTTAPTASSPPTGWSNLQVYASPTIIEPQLISKVAFNITNNSFDSSALVAVGLYDNSKNLLCETGWLNVDVAGNKSKTLATPLWVVGQQGYIAWSATYSVAGTFYAIPFTSATEQPFFNANLGVLGKSNQTAASGSAGDPAMPATLGTIATHTNNIPVLIVTAST